MKSQQYQTHYNAGQHIFKLGDQGDCAFIIESGCVEIYIDRSDSKLVIRHMAAGDLLGEMAIIDDLPRSASAVALEDTEVIVIPRDYLIQKIECSDPTVRFFLNIIIERFRDVHNRLTRVFEGVNPSESTLELIHLGNPETEKALMKQYIKIQDRILNAVNTAQPQNVQKHIKADVRTTKKSLTVVTDLERALENNEFRVLYQPIINMATSTIAGCEALVRWQHPERGLLSPHDFIPDAEHTGLIIPLGYWIAQQACQFQNSISTQNNKKFFTTINLSGKQFDDSKLVENLEDAVSRYAAKPELIKFEITESLLMDNPELASRALNQLKESGVQLAIDDFGTGYSSLSYLHQFPFDVLKIDRSFVSTILHSKKSKEIVKALIMLSHNLNMKVVAEGIETEFERDMIKIYKPEYGQGYLYSRPITADDFQKLIQ